jgi:sec-independent protein translocase protein TatC
MKPNRGTMTFWEHLDELRMRLIKAAIAFLVGSTVAWFFRERLLELLTAPFLGAWKTGAIPGAAALHFPAPASLFFAYVKLSVLGGLLMALPIILYQLWAFIAPGLYAREKKLALPFVFFSCLLFAAGGYFGWRVAFPAAFQWLLEFSGPVGGLEVKPTVMIEDYLDLVTRMLLAFGIAFELPMLVFFLSVAGIVTHRHLIRFARYFVVIAFVVGAFLTPPDVISQLLLAGPLIVLYGLSVGIAYVFGRQRKLEEEAKRTAEP